MAKYKYKVPKYRPRAWLWWCALAVALIGGGYYYYLAEYLDDPSTRMEDEFRAKITAIVTGATVTVMIICATSQLWFKR